jgi:GTPase
LEVTDTKCILRVEIPAKNSQQTRLAEHVRLAPKHRVFLWSGDPNLQAQNTPSFRVDSSRSVILFTLSRDTAEIEELVRSLGYSIVDKVVQNRSRPDPETFLGRGKLAEYRRSLTSREGPPLASNGKLLAVVDGALKPPQLFSVEDILRIEVWDRIRVILEIFQQKAQVKEARLQVELARLRYELPFVHEALHRTLTGEHPGFMGGGELPMRTYETHLKRRTGKIQQELRAVRKERAQRREGRRKGGFRLVAIAGYTNSGKSSLLNALCGSEATVENLYFSTLQTTTRRLRPQYSNGRHTSLLFTDTVGFISDLPPWLIDAFGSTLEEVSSSDVILITLDASEPLPIVREKLDTVWQLLDQLNSTKRRIIVLNKSDLVPDNLRNDIHNTLFQNTYYLRVPKRWTSTRNEEGLQQLVDQLIEETLPHHNLQIDIDLVQSGHLSFESWLRDHTDIVSDTKDGEQRKLVVRVSQEEYPRVRRQAHKVGATVTELHSTGNHGGAPGMSNSGA